VDTWAVKQTVGKLKTADKVPKSADTSGDAYLLKKGKKGEKPLGWWVCTARTL
jgi:hypothetical protein